MLNEVVNPLVIEIRSILDIARTKIAQTINNELIISYWKIGEVIVRFE